MLEISLLTKNDHECSTQTVCAMQVQKPSWLNKYQ